MAGPAATTTTVPDGHVPLPPGPDAFAAFVAFRAAEVLINMEDRSTYKTRILSVRSSRPVNTTLGRRALVWHDGYYDKDVFDAAVQLLRLHDVVHTDDFPRVVSFATHELRHRLEHALGSGAVLVTIAIDGTDLDHEWSPAPGKIRATKACTSLVVRDARFHDDLHMVTAALLLGPDVADAIPNLLCGTNVIRLALSIRPTLIPALALDGKGRALVFSKRADACGHCGASSGLCRTLTYDETNQRPLVSIEEYRAVLGNVVDDLIDAIMRIRPPPASRDHAARFATLLITSGWRHAVTVLLYWCIATTGKWDDLMPKLKAIPHALGKGERPSILGAKQIIEQKLWDDPTPKGGFDVLMEGRDVDACSTALQRIQAALPVAWRSAGGHSLYHNLQLCSLIPGLVPLDLAEEGSERSHQAIKPVKPLSSPPDARELLQRTRLLSLLEKADLMDPQTGMLRRPACMN